MNGQAFLHARDALRGRAAARRRVEGPAPLDRRRSRARRPPRRPRVPRQLQVPLAHRRERVARSTSSTACSRAATGSAAAATGSTRSRPPSTPRCTRRSATPSTSRCPHDVTELDAEQRRDARALVRARQRVAGRRRRALRRRSSSASPTSRRAAGAPRSARRPRRCCGGCCASAARPTSCSARRRKGFMRLRIATPWDWRQQFELRQFDVEPRAGGQPMVAWDAIVRRRADGTRACRARARRGPLESRPLLRTARGEGVPRHPARRGAGLLPARPDRSRTPVRWMAMATESDGHVAGAHRPRPAQGRSAPKVAVEHVDLDVAARLVLRHRRARTARARPRRCAWRPACCAPTPARCGSTASTCGPIRSRPSRASACCPKTSRCSNG